MAELLVLDVLESGQTLARADVLAVAEIVAGQLVDEHDLCRHHGDIGPHTVLLDLAGSAEIRVRDARLLEPAPIQRPPSWPIAPEGASGLAADVFALGQLLRSLDAHARASSDDVGLPPYIHRMIDPDPARRPTVRDLLAAFDEGQLRPPTAPVSTMAASQALSTPRMAESAVETAARPTQGMELARRSSWPPAVAAATIFALVLAGGLWWTNRDDPAIRDAGADRAVAVDGAAPDVPGTHEGTDAAGEPDEAPTAEQAPATEGPPGPDRPTPGATLAPDITTTPDGGPDTVAAPGPQAEGSTEFDQAWCRSHGVFVARVQTVNYRATICRDGDTVNYHGLNLIDGLAIRTPATEHGAGWTAHGEEGVTYEVSKEVFEVRRGDTLLASEDVVNFIDPTDEGDYRPWDLAQDEPISYPACRGAAIVVLDTFDNLQGVNVQVRESLEAHPGASYLNTETACDSLESPSHQRGNRFITFYWAGHDTEQVCELIESTGTHGLWLQDDVPPGEQVDCG